MYVCVCFLLLASHFVCTRPSSPSAPKPQVLEVATQRTQSGRKKTILALTSSPLIPQRVNVKISCLLTPLRATMRISYLLTPLKAMEPFLAHHPPTATLRRQKPSNQTW